MRALWSINREPESIDREPGSISKLPDDDGTGPVTPVRSTWERVLPWMMSLVFAGLYATISVAGFERLQVRSFDLGIFEQAIRHYAYLQAPIVDIERAW
jgi:hypothetical protein